MSRKTRWISLLLIVTLLSSNALSAYAKTPVTTSSSSSVVAESKAEEATHTPTPSTTPETTPEATSPAATETPAATPRTEEAEKTTTTPTPSIKEEFPSAEDELEALPTPQELVTKEELNNIIGMGVDEEIDPKVDAVEEILKANPEDEGILQMAAKEAGITEELAEKKAALEEKIENESSEDSSAAVQDTNFLRKIESLFVEDVQAAPIPDTDHQSGPAVTYVPPATQSEAMAELSAFVLSKKMTGAGDWDSTSDQNGNDSSASNDYLRTGDIVTYVLSYSTKLKDPYLYNTIKGTRLYVKYELPVASSVATWDLTAMSTWLHVTSRTESGGKQTLIGYRDLPDSNNAFDIPGAGTVDCVIKLNSTTSSTNVSAGQTITPTFTGWLEAKNNAAPPSWAMTSTNNVTPRFIVSVGPFIQIVMDAAESKGNDSNGYTALDRWGHARTMYGDRTMFDYHITIGKKNGSTKGVAALASGSNLSWTMSLNSSSQRNNVSPAAITVYNGVDYSKVYDYFWYVTNNPDVGQYVTNIGVAGLYEDDKWDNGYYALEHFVQNGMREGRQASPNFNANYYKNRYSDVAAYAGSDKRKLYQHYMEHGYAEGRQGSAITDSSGKNFLYTAINRIDHGIMLGTEGITPSAGYGNYQSLTWQNNLYKATVNSLAGYNPGNVPSKGTVTAMWSTTGRTPWRGGNYTLNLKATSITANFAQGIGQKTFNVDTGGGKAWSQEGVGGWVHYGFLRDYTSDITGASGSTYRKTLSGGYYETANRIGYGGQFWLSRCWDNEQFESENYVILQTLFDNTKVQLYSPNGGEPQSYAWFWHRDKEIKSNWKGLAKGIYWDVRYLTLKNGGNLTDAMHKTRSVRQQSYTRNNADEISKNFNIYSSYASVPDKSKICGVLFEFKHTDVYENNQSYSADSWMTFTQASIAMKVVENPSNINKSAKFSFGAQGWSTSGASNFGSQFSNIYYDPVKFNADGSVKPYSTAVTSGTSIVYGQTLYIQGGEYSVLTRHADGSESKVLDLTNAGGTIQYKYTPSINSPFTVVSGQNGTVTLNSGSTAFTFPASQGLSIGNTKLNYNQTYNFSQFVSGQTGTFVVRRTSATTATITFNNVKSTPGLPTFTATYNIDPTKLKLSDTVTNTATITGDSFPVTKESGHISTASLAFTTINSNVLKKTVDKDMMNDGDTLTYQITYHNLQGDNQPVNIRDVLPARNDDLGSEIARDATLKVTSATASTTGGSKITVKNTNNVITATGTLKNGEKLTITVKLHCSGLYGNDVLRNKATQTYNGLTIESNMVETGVRIPGKVKIHKTDVENGEILKDGTFNVYAWDVKNNRWGTTPVATCKWNEAEQALVSNTFSRQDRSKDPAQNDGRFKVVEDVSPAGYINYGWEEEITIDATDASVPPQEFSFDLTNKPNKYKIIKVNRHDERLEGITYAVMRVGDEQRYYTTDENGEINLRALAPGRWTYWETETLDPYHLDATVHSFTVTIDGRIEGEEEVSAKWINEHSQKVKISKTDTWTGLPTHEGSGFPNGCEFTAYEYSVASGDYKTSPYLTIMYLDGQFVDKKTGKWARFVWQEDNQGKFKIKETKQTPGYILDDQEQFYTITEVPVDDFITFDFENEPNKYTIIKENTKGEKLSGVSFSLWRVGSGQSVVHTTDENGEINLDRLVPGTWRYQEATAPDGYEVDGTVHEFIIHENGKISGTLRLDSKVILNRKESQLKITKIDSETGLEYDVETAFPEGTEFDIYEYDKTTGTYKETPSKHIITKKESEVQSPVTVGKEAENIPSDKLDGDYSDAIALIDTGVASDAENVIARTSVIGTDASDDNGHGSFMAKTIYQENPDARILSIKAVDSDGYASFEDLCAAMRVAIDAKVRVINIAVAAKASKKAERLEELIKEAYDAGIIVVTAAGNYGDNAINYAPANSPYAVTATAVTKDGDVKEHANYGECVDQYVFAESTSEASAKTAATIKELPKKRAAEQITLAEEPDATEKLITQAPVVTDWLCADVGSNVRVMYFNITGTTTSYGTANLYTGTSAPWNISETVSLGRSSWSRDGRSFNYAAQFTPSKFPGGKPNNPFAIKIVIDGTTVMDVVKMGGWGFSLTFKDAVSGGTIDTWNLYCGQRFGSGNNTMATDQVPWKDNTKAGPAKTGYTFQGWYTARTGGTKLGTYTKLAANLSGVTPTSAICSTVVATTAWAQYTPNPYKQIVKVRYQKADGTWDTYKDVINENRNYGTTVSWSRAADSTYNAASISYTVNSTSTTTKYVDVTRKQYTATWNRTSGNTQSENNRTLYAEQAMGTLPTATKGARSAAGIYAYDFLGWYTSESGGSKISATTAMPKENTTYYAHWTPHNYELTYDLDGGTINPANPTSYTIESADIGLKNPTKPGYKFTGWTEYVDGTSTGTRLFFTIPSGSIGDRRYVANWKAYDPATFVDEDTGYIPILTETENNEGKFKIVETKAAPGYILDDEEVEINIVEDSVDGKISASFSNTPNKVQIKKVNTSGDVLANAIFEVWHESDPDEVRTETSGTDGLITLMRLKSGKWFYREVTAPTGYSLDSTIGSFEIDGKGRVVGDAVKTAINVPNDAYSFTIKKVNEDGAALPDAEFEIYKQDIDPASGEATSDYALYETRTSGSNGLITLDHMENHPNTRWKYIETSAASGYAPDTNERYFTVDSEGKVTGANSVAIVNRKNGLVIRKTDGSGTSLHGAVFSITGGSIGGNYTTDAGGCITLRDIAPGTYSFVETKSPSGYMIKDGQTPTSFVVNDDLSITVNGETTDIAEVEVVNDPSNFTINKVNENNEAIEGVTFRITNGENYNVTKTSDASGKIVVPKLRPGRYTYEELSAPAGYAADGKGEIIVNDDGTLDVDSVTVVNEPNKFTLKKIDDEGSAIEGVVFTIDGTEYSTDENGEITLERLSPGSYAITETGVKAGYRAPVSNTATLIVDENGKLNVYSDGLVSEFIGGSTGKLTATITNEKLIRYQLKIAKSDVDTAEMLEGAEFSAYEWNGSGYNDTPIAVSVAVPSNPLSIIQTKGLYTISDLQETVQNEGKFLIVETKAPTGYAATFSREINIRELDESFVVNAPNRKNAIEFRKVNKEGEALSGAAFRVFNQEGFEELVTTNGDGIAKVESLLAGTYSIEEVTAPDGYYRDREIRQVVVSENGLVDGEIVKTIRLENIYADPYVLNLQLTKKDAETADLLDGAEFVLYEYSDELKDYDYEHPHEVIYDSSNGYYILAEDVVTDANNLAQFKIVETKSQSGYLKGYEEEIQLDVRRLGQVDPCTACGEVGSYPDTTVTITPNAGGGTIQMDLPSWVTIDSITDDAGQSYSVSDNSFSLFALGGGGTLTFTYTRADGVTAEAIVPKADGSFLPNILVHINQTLNGELFTIQGSECELCHGTGQIGEDDGTVTVKLEAENEKNEFKVIKEDENGDPMKDITFTLYLIPALSFEESDADEGTVIDLVPEDITPASATLVKVKDYKTDENGIISIRGIEPGQYVLKETETKPGYILDETEHKFTVDEDGVIRMGDVEQNTINVVNYPNTLRVIKNNERGELVDGAVFELRKDNELIKTFTDNSEIKQALEDGSYVVTEKAAPDGYFLNENEMSFTVEDGLIEGLESFTLIQKNVSEEDLRTNGGFIEIEKLHGYTGDPMEGVTFSVYEWSESTGAYGSEPIAELSYDGPGRYISEAGTLLYTDDNLGKYMVVETAAPTGFVREFTEEIDFTKQSTYSFTGDAAVRNNPNSFTIIKRDAVDSTVLEGAVFEVWSESDPTKVEYTTNIIGQIRLEGLTNGETYYYREKTPPEGYARNRTTYQFTVAEDGKIDGLANATSDVLNKRVTKITIHKNINEQYEHFGTPSFLFKVWGYDSYGEYHEWIRSITMDGGALNGTSVIEDVPPGAYAIKELPVSRYVEKEVTPIQNVVDSSDPDAVLYNVDERLIGEWVAEVDQNKPGEILYTNEITQYEKNSHVTIVNNHLTARE